jgi:hypothetical protein
MGAKVVFQHCALWPASIPWPVSIIGTESYACTYLFDFSIYKDDYREFHMDYKCFLSIN